MTFGYLEAKSGVITGYSWRQFIEMLKRVIGDGQVRGGQIETVRRDIAVVVELSEKLNVWGSSGTEVVHSFIEMSVCGRFDDGSCQIVVIKNF